MKPGFPALLMVSALLAPLLVFAAPETQPAAQQKAQQEDFEVYDSVPANGPFTIASGFYALPFDQGTFERGLDNQFAVNEAYGLPLATYLVNKTTHQILIRLEDGYLEPSQLEVETAPDKTFVILRQVFRSDTLFQGVYLISEDGNHIVANVQSAWEDFHGALDKYLSKKNKGYSDILASTGQPIVKLKKASGDGVYSFTFEGEEFRGSSFIKGEGRLKKIGIGKDTKFQLLEAKVREASD